MASRLAKLEASLNELNSALNQVEVKEREVKSITEQATHEIDQWKEEVHGMGWLKRNRQLLSLNYCIFICF